jgi:hypothetical protein
MLEPKWLLGTNQYDDDDEYRINDVFLRTIRAAELGS